VVPTIPRPVKVPETVTWEVIFHNPEYALGYPDQRDWNKGGGYSFDLLDNHRNSFMWGWRWNPEDRVVDATGYAHVNNQVVKEDYNLFQVEKKEPFRVNITILPNQYVYVFQTESGKDLLITLPHNNDPGDRSGKTITPTFGGNRVPNKIVSFSLKKVNGLYL
jgi:hypothetical protein